MPPDSQRRDRQAKRCAAGDRVLPASNRPMPTNRTVQPGDCIASIAQESGFSDYHKIYDDPANADLKKKRPNPNVLAVGDVVVIPDVTSKSVSVASGKEHTLVVATVPTLLRIRIIDETGKGMKDLDYELVVGPITYSGKTPESGEIEAGIISAVQKTGTLRLWKKKEAGIDGYSFPLELGGLEHESVDSACQARLMNLGFDCGGITGDVDARTRNAVRRFQKDTKLEITGKLEKDQQDKTREKLRTQHEGL